MAKYQMKRKYTDEQWRILAEANCVEIAESLGMEIDEKASAGVSYKIAHSGGLTIFKNGKGWKHQGDGAKGAAIQLVQYHTGCRYVEALDYIHERIFHGRFGMDLIDTANAKFKSEFERQPTQSQAKQTLSEEQNSVFILPKFVRPTRAYAYLCQTRGINSTIVNELVQSGKIRQDEKGNVCFVGYDGKGTAVSCFKRGTLTKPQDAPPDWKAYRGYVSGSNKNYDFRIDGTSDKVIVFEAAIDAVSHANISYEVRGTPINSDTRVCLGGREGGALKQLLSDNPDRFKTIWLCLDNDKFGRESAEKIEKEIASEFPNKYDVKIFFSHNKDWNEDLTQARTITAQTGQSFLDAVKMQRTDTVPDEFKLHKAESAPPPMTFVDESTGENFVPGEPPSEDYFNQQNYDMEM